MGLHSAVSTLSPVATSIHPGTCACIVLLPLAYLLNFAKYIGTSFCSVMVCFALLPVTFPSKSLPRTDSPPWNGQFLSVHVSLFGFFTSRPILFFKCYPSLLPYNIKSSQMVSCVCHHHLLVSACPLHKMQT